jgi:hypothetical protein
MRPPAKNDDSHSRQPVQRMTFAQLTKRAVAELQAKTTAHAGTWRLDEADWSVDQDEGTIVFTTPKRIRATAPVQIIGTYNSEDGTWLWGWDHPSVAAPLAEHAKRLLAFGEKHGIRLLTTRKLDCPEQQCWEFTALACMLCQAQGGYRGPAGSALVFMTFGEVRLSKSP